MDVQETAQELSEKIASQLRVRGAGSLEDVATRAGRKLPKRYHRDVAAFVQAEGVAGNPKLAHQVDEKQLKRAQKRLNAFLEKQDPASERRAEILDSVAKIAFVLFVIVLAVFFFAVRQGAFD